MFLFLKYFNFDEINLIISWKKNPQSNASNNCINYKAAKPVVMIPTPNLGPFAILPLFGSQTQYTQSHASNNLP